MKNSSTDTFKHGIAKPMLCDVLIHYGNNKFDEDLFLPIKNKRWEKPDGGLWTSPKNSKWGWKDWWISSEFRLTRRSMSKSAWPGKKAVSCRPLPGLLSILFPPRRKTPWRYPWIIRQPGVVEDFPRTKAQSPRWQTAPFSYWSKFIPVRIVF